MVALNLQVGAGPDDGSWVPATFHPDQIVTYLDTSPRHSFFRLTGAGIAALAGATILTCKMQLRGADGFAESGTVDGLIYFVKEANPAAPVSVADANGRSLTAGTAYNNIVVTNDTFVDTVDFSAELTELLAAHNPESLLIYIKHVATDYVGWDTYEAGASFAAKLDLTYTPAPAGYTRPYSRMSLLGA